MKLFSWNVNGIRAAWRKGSLPQWIADCGADFISLQETKAKVAQLEPEMIAPKGFRSYFFSAERGGYSGVAIYCKNEPLDVIYGLDRSEYDCEGRVLTLETEHFYLMNAYFPHTRHDLSRLDYKLAFCNDVLEACNRLQAKGKPVILVGDYNVAHRDIDLANPKANRKNPGFLPEEKSWMDRLLASGFHDVFRDKYGEEPGHYTWWSFRKGVRERNVGWRIDYHCITDGLVDRVADVGHLPMVYGSDHCPIMLDLKD